MKFGVVCDVEGKTYLDNGATVEVGGMRYIFYLKDKARNVIAWANGPGIVFIEIGER